MSTDQRGTPLNLHIVRGTDYSFTITVTDAAGAAYALDTATINADLLNAAGSVVDSLNSSVAGAGNNEVTLSLTDTETTALTDDRYRLAFDVTEGSDTAAWFVGFAYLYDRGVARGGNDEPSQLLVKNGTLRATFS